MPCILRKNPDTFARLYPHGVNLTRGVCLCHAQPFTWGQEARRLIRVDIAREYIEALALAEADDTATLADADYTASSVSARNLRETEAMLFADRAYRKALAPANRGYSEVRAVTWFDMCCPLLSKGVNANDQRNQPQSA
jgi:hypothetical protein